jgi:hypothetical protein
VCNATNKNLVAATTNLSNNKDKHADRPAKEVRHPTSSTYAYVEPPWLGTVHFHKSMYRQDVLCVVIECVM